MHVPRRDRAILLRQLRAQRQAGQFERVEFLPEYAEGFAVECYKGDRLVETIIFANRQALARWAMENADVTTVQVKLFSFQHRRYVDAGTAFK